MRLLLSVFIISLCSFTCTKQQDELAARGGIATETITVDFRAFPARGIYTIINQQTSEVYTFDSDSMTYYQQPIVAGTYQTRWQILETTEDKHAVAKLLNESQGTIADWKNSTILINGHDMKGTFTFLKAPK